MRLAFLLHLVKEDRHHLDLVCYWLYHLLDYLLPWVGTTVFHSLSRLDDVLDLFLVLLQDPLLLVQQVVLGCHYLHSHRLVSVDRWAGVTIT